MDTKCPFCGAPISGTDSSCLACLMDLALTPGEDQGEHTLPEEPSEQAAAQSAAPHELKAGDRLGPYIVDRVLGQGGMGVVYLAQQTAPVQRPVAIKVIKVGLDTRSVLTRFQAEQQALARMEHEGIARLFEAGQTPEGRPYFAMEFIDGETITDYCDANKLGVRERLDLFKQVCSAVQHAHQRGVVHRDLKPSNILVSIHDDGRAVPTVIDFGIAKATEHSLTEESLFTEVGVLLGTPEYMSPEQAAIHPLAVDTRTDVYSLGVVLYELLTGALPFDARELRKAGWDEIRRRIREETPFRPSDRLDTLGAIAADTASNRKRSTSSALKRDLAGDLDLIAMKALEKDPDRRYTSPAELAADVDRHLRSEPVLARAPSALYQLQKLIVRNPVVSALVVSFVALSLFFGVWMTVLYRQSQSNLDRALEAEEQAEAGRQRAEAAELEAREVSDFLIGVFEVSDPSETKGNTVTARDLLDEAAESISEELEGQPAIQATLLDTMGQAYRSLGLFDRAEELISEGLTRRRELFGDDSLEVTASKIQLATTQSELGQMDVAEATIRETLEQLEAFPDAERERASALSMLMVIEWRRGRAAKAIPLAEQLVETSARLSGTDSEDYFAAKNSLGNLLLATSQFDRAEELFLEVIDYRERVLGPDHVKTGESLNNLAETYKRQARYDEAEPIYLRSLEIDKKTYDPDHPNLGYDYNNLGTLYSRMKRWEDSERHYKESLRIRKKSLPPNHPLIAWTYDNLGNLYYRWGRYDDAEPMIQEALRIAKIAVGEQSIDYTIVLGNLSNLRAAQDRYEESSALIRKALSIHESLGTQRTTQASDNWYNLAKNYEREKRYAEAVDALETSLAITMEILSAEHPDAKMTQEALERVRGLMQEADGDG